MNAIKHHANLLHEYRDEFARIFGQSLNRFMNPLFGFNIMQFESHYNLYSDDKSIAELTEAKFGGRGREIIKKLLDPTPVEENETWVNMDAPTVPQPGDTSGYKPVKFKFYKYDMSEVEVDAFTKGNGLYIHQDLTRRGYAITTKDGLLVCYCDNITKAKKAASMYSRAVDFANMGVDPNKAQMEAVKRMARGVVAAGLANVSLPNEA